MEKGFRFFRSCFARFKKRKHINLRAITNHAQEIPIDAINRIRPFHLFIRYYALNTIETAFLSIGVGKYYLGNIANMDQIPL